MTAWSAVHVRQQHTFLLEEEVVDQLHHCYSVSRHQTVLPDEVESPLLDLSAFGLWDMNWQPVTL